MCDVSTDEVIFSRRSVRAFEKREVGRELLDALCEAARWAPSGMNNQPWRFVTVEKPETLSMLAGFTKYGNLVRNCGGGVAVFLNLPSVYNRTKDLQSIGAALENMLLRAEGLGLGACWLGEILNRREEVERALAVPETLELMALVVVGWPKELHRETPREREPLSNLIVGRY